MAEDAFITVIMSAWLAENIQKVSDSIQLAGIAAAELARELDAESEDEA